MSQQRTPACRDWAEGPQEAACDLQQLHPCQTLHIFLPHIPIPHHLPGLCEPTGTPAVPEQGACCDRSCTNPKSIPIPQQPAATQPGPAPKQVMSGGSSARHRQLEELCCHPRGPQWSNPPWQQLPPPKTHCSPGQPRCLMNFGIAAAASQGAQPAHARAGLTHVRGD